MPELLKAALMVPHDIASWRKVLSDLNAFAERQNWIPGAWTRTWSELVAATNRCQWCGIGGDADVGIVPSRSVLDPNRIPRLVIMDEEWPPPPEPGRQRPHWHR